MKTFGDIRAGALLAMALPVLVSAQAPRVVDGPKKPARSAVQGDRVTPIWTDHLKLTTYPSDVAVAPGDRALLVVEIEPGEGMHVYAPGAESYRIIR